MAGRTPEITDFNLMTEKHHVKQTHTVPLHFFFIISLFLGIFWGFWLSSQLSGEKMDLYRDVGYLICCFFVFFLYF